MESLSPKLKIMAHHYYFQNYYFWLFPLLSLHQRPSRRSSRTSIFPIRSDPIVTFLLHCSEASGRLDPILSDPISQKGPTMNTQTTRPIGIKTTYIIDGNDGTTTTTSEIFDASRSDAYEARVGLPVGIEPVKVRSVSKRTRTHTHTHAENIENAIINTVVFYLDRVVFVVAPANRN